VTQPGSGEENLEVDHFRGLSGEFDHPVGDNLYIASFDRNVHGSFGSELFGSALSEYDGITIPSGSGQTLTTFSLRALLQPTPTLGVSLGNYITWSDMHYTPGGGTFQDLTNSNDSPRLAVTWHPSANTSYRFAAGSSIAPPYISLVNVPSTPPEPNSEGAPSYYSQQISNPNLKPETAFGFDIGSDVRLAKAGIVLSGDAYITDLQGQYITETIPDGTFTPTEGTNAGKTAPLYTTETINLGHSRYEGVELAARRVVAQGFGYVVQGALIRAYPYDVSPSVYATAFGPNTTNLAILNNVNFQGSGLGYNGYSFGRVPYATGYGEVSYSARRARFALGATYYGNNNSLGRPAYFVTNASLRYDLSPTVGLYLTAYNLTDTYGSNTYNINGGIPVPLVNGMLGATAAGTVGPPMYRASVHIKLGQ
jgi:outer membrane receptor protein involved in Fe transport